MGFKNLAVFVALLLVTVALAAQPAQAQFRRGYLSPSGNGAPCPTSAGNSCVNVNGNTLLLGDGTTTTDYQIVGVGGIVSGSTVDFTFNGTAPGLFTPSPTAPNSIANSNSDFSVIACGSNDFPSSSGTTTVFGIFDSTQNFISGDCTNLGKTITPPGNFLTETTCATNMVCLSFAGAGLPETWFFAEDITDGGPNVTGFTVTLSGSGSGDGGGGGGTPVPEPASLTLLAAGVVGLGALRRKRAA